MPELVFCHKQKEDELIVHFAISRLVWIAMCERKCLLRYNDVPCRAVAAGSSVQVLNQLGQNV